MTIGSLLVPDLVSRTITKGHDSHIRGRTTKDMRRRSDDEQGRARMSEDERCWADISRLPEDNGGRARMKLVTRRSISPLILLSNKVRHSKASRVLLTHRSIQIDGSTNASAMMIALATIVERPALVLCYIREQPRSVYNRYGVLTRNKKDEVAMLNDSRQDRCLSRLKTKLCDGMIVCGSN